MGVGICIAKKKNNSFMQKKNKSMYTCIWIKYKIKVDTIGHQMYSII